MAYDLKPLMALEKQLREKLDPIPEFKQWESIQIAISLLKNGVQSNAIESATSNGSNKTEIPSAYESGLTWKNKILFALNKTNGGFVSDIIAELKKNGTKEEDDWLEKRISTMASSMKKAKILGAKYSGKKAKYYIVDK